MSKKISLNDYLMGRDIAYPPNEEQLTNAKITVERVNRLLAYYYADNPSSSKKGVSSGYRPSQINAQIKNAAKKSKHMNCQACDIIDTDRSLAKWVRANKDKLEEVGLWIEDIDYTPTWVHFQTVPPRSGKREFIP